MRFVAARNALISLAVATGLGAPTAIHAQVAYDAPTGRVEVLGLRRWTLPMLQDSVRRYVRGQELHDAACMVTLRDSLHFVEASVERFEMAPPGQPRRSFLTIKLIEPEQAATVQWDTRRRDEFSSLLPDYAPPVLAMTDSTGAVFRARLYQWLQYADSASRQRALARTNESGRADANRTWAFLDARRTDADWARAARTLPTDGLWVNRMMAAAVLSNFAARDSAWFLLVRALRDPHEGVRGAAGIVLRTLPGRPIDWRGSVNDLRLLLGGTNLPAMQTVFELLAKTDVDPTLAAPLLRNNAGWILDHLGAESPMAADAAHRLLVRLNAGKDLGMSRSAWEAWTRAL